MEFWISLLVLALLAVPVLLLVALVSLSGLKRRVTALEEALRQRTPLRGDATDTSVAAGSDTERAPVFPTSPAAAWSEPAWMSHPERLRVAELQADEAAGPVPPATEPPPAEPMGVPASASAPPPLSKQPRPVLPRQQQEPDIFTTAMGVVKRWFTEGNVPVKIGMLVLLAGVAALLKYASDQGWMRFPIELRLAGISAAALAGLVFGWRQRERRRGFALAVQGGAIGVLLLTVFAAVKLYALLGAGPALGLSVALIAGMGVLAVVQESRTLAVLGILAGFMAPIWLSTGSGNHVALFTYYAVLNAAILAIAWWRPWRALNLLGFVFTFGIGTVWGVLDYEPAKFASTEPFLLLFFAFYLLIPILYARRQAAGRGDLIDGCLVFGTPLIAFSLQAGLLRGDSDALALCALALAALYAMLAWCFIRRERYAVLGQAYALLAVGFATLAIPLALSARATASVFALEGAVLVWLGLRQKRLLPQLSGMGLQLAAAVAMAFGGIAGYGAMTAVANPTFMGALLIAVAGFASAWSYQQRDRVVPALLYYLWGLLWWCGNGINEIERFVDYGMRADVLLAFVAFTAWLAAEAQRRWPSSALVLTTLAGFVTAIPLAFAQMEAHDYPFQGMGAWAWLLFAALGVRSLLCLRASQDRFAAWAQFVWWLVWPLVLSLLSSWLSERFGLAQGWRLALLVLPWLAIALVALYRWPWLSTPLGDRFEPARRPLQLVYFGILGGWWLLTLFQPGSSAPLPWVPVLNPLELAQLAALVLIACWLWSTQAPAWLRGLRVFAMAGAGFAMVTSVTLHAVGHWMRIPWGPGLLSSSEAQTSLTVVWSLLGVVGWVLGSRRGHRGLWRVGALLMAVVLAKLVLVDRQHLGNLLGIASFIAYGLLCTVVGFFAPAPPRGEHREDIKESEA